MVLNESVRAALQRAAVTQDKALLAKAFSTLQSALTSQIAQEKPSIELLVLCCENAVKVAEFAVAKKCLDLFFTELRRYTVAKEAVPNGSSATARAYFALAHVFAHATRTLKGDDLVAGTKQAIKQVLHGMDVAKATARYAFLVYNGSVAFWHVARPIMRTGYWIHLQEAFAALLPCMSSVQGHPAWKARLSAAYALALHEGGKVEDALKQAEAAIALAPAAASELCNELIALKAHLLAVSGKAGKADAGKGAKAAGQDAKAAAAAEARAAVQTVLSGKLTGKPAEALLQAALTKLCPGVGAPPPGAPLLEVAMIAWAAEVSGNSALAEAAASRAAASSDLRPRVWSDLTRAQQAIASLGPPGKLRLTAAAVAAHEAALDSLENCISAFRSTSDVAGLHAACRVVWNVGLPMLQHNLHPRVKRAFTTAAKALEAIDSPLTELRALLHLELAHCDVDDDLLASAKQQAAAAFQQDYIGAGPEAEHFQRRRPLDRIIEPLLRALTLKTDIYNDPTGPEDRAMLLLERAKEAKTVPVREDYLGKCIDALRALPLLAAPSLEASRAPDGAAARHAARSGTALWAAVVKTAWRSRLHQLVFTAAPYALASFWDADVDRDMVLLQAEVSYIEAEAAVVALRELQEEVVLPLTGGAPDVDDAGLRLPPGSVEQAQQLVMDAIVTGMKLAHKVQLAWCVINGAIYAWNAFLPRLVENRHVEVKAVLASVHELLLRLDASEQDGRLLCDITYALMQAHTHAYFLKIIQPPRPPPTPDADPEDAEAPWPVLRPGHLGYFNLVAAREEARKRPEAKAGSPLAAEARKELQAALQVAQQALVKLGDTPCQALIELYARVRQLLDEPGDVASVASASQRSTAKARSAGKV